MKNIFIVLLLCLFPMSVSAQKGTTTRNRVKQPTTLVTKAMADKIADFCLGADPFDTDFGNCIGTLAEPYPF